MPRNKVNIAAFAPIPSASVNHRQGEALGTPQGTHCQLQIAQEVSDTLNHGKFLLLRFTQVALRPYEFENKGD